MAHGGRTSDVGEIRGLRHERIALPWPTESPIKLSGPPWGVFVRPCRFAAPRWFQDHIHLTSTLHDLQRSQRRIRAACEGQTIWILGRIKFRPPVRVRFGSTPLRISCISRQPRAASGSAEKYKEIRKGVDPKRPELGGRELDPAPYPLLSAFGMPRVYALLGPSGDRAECWSGGCDL